MSSKDAIKAPAKEAKAKMTKVEPPSPKYGPEWQKWYLETQKNAK